MLIRFFWSLLNSTVVYAYPSYASFKSLSRRPASEQDLERWLMYWSVVGCIIALEYLAEWSVSWIPFYWLLKTIFLLWLALPQTQGATYIYERRLAPLLTTYEPTIDSYIGQYKKRLYTSFQNALRTIWEQISGLIAQHTGINLNAIDPAASPNTAAAAQNANMGQGAQLALGLWRTWGPSILSAMRPPQAEAEAEATDAAATPAAPAPTAPTATASSTLAPPRPTTSHHRGASNRSNSDLDTIRARRKQIEAELARLTALEQRQEADLPNIPSASNLAQSVYLSDASDGSFDTNARVSGRYEEINKDDVSEESDVDGDGLRTRPQSGVNRWSFWGRSPNAYQQIKED